MPRVPGACVFGVVVLLFVLCVFSIFLALGRADPVDCFIERNPYLLNSLCLNAI